MLARVGLIGDIHCQQKRLQQVLRHFRDLKVETLLAVGDIADGPGDLNETCALLESAGALVVTGNHDRWLLAGQMRDLPEAIPLHAVSAKTRAYLEALPKTRSFESPRGKVLLCHGLGEDDMASVKPDDYGHALEANGALWELVEGRRARFVINGHSHRPMLRTISGLTILNAGTLSAHRPVCSVADFNAGFMQVYDVQEHHVSEAEHWDFEHKSRPR